MALTSFGKHEPPYPRPARKNLGLIRWSRPMALAMAVMSAFGIFWHMLATVFMKLIYARQVFWLFPTSRGGLLNSGSES